MIYEEIIKKIQVKYAPLSTECVTALLGLLEIKSFQKDEILVKEGQYSKKAFFIISGSARAYYYKNEKDVTDWFAFESEFICPIVSFFSDKASPHYIQTLEDSTFAEISKETMDELTKTHWELERLIRVIVTETMLKQQRRISSILFHSAEEKYKQLLHDYPNILHRIPLTHIASHLGMTLETLSRVRRVQI